MLALLCLWWHVSRRTNSKARRPVLTGLRHPLSGFDHVLAMISVGLWGAQLGAPAMWLLAGDLPDVMAFGGFLGLVGLPCPESNRESPCSAIRSASWVAGRRSRRSLVAAALVGFFAIFHEHAHGTGAHPPGQSGWHTALDFVVATGCLHGARHRDRAWCTVGRLARPRSRLAGGVVALAGVDSSGGRSHEIACHQSLERRVRSVRLRAPRALPQPRRTSSQQGSVPFTTACRTCS